jgi:hypothetical protein
MTEWKFRFIFETALIHVGDNHFNHFKSFIIALKNQNEQRSIPTRPRKKREKY